MKTGLFDYKRLVDEFTEFVYNTATELDLSVLLNFAERFKENACYKLPVIRDAAMKAGNTVIGIPVDVGTQEAINKVESPVAKVTISPRSGFERREATHSDNVARQSGDDTGVVATPAPMSFDAYGDPVA